MCLEFLDVGITCCDQRRPHSIIARNNFCFVWLVVYVVAVSSSIVRAEPIAFVKGDAVFPAIILDNSRFLNGMPIVDAPQFGAWPDFGVMLDLSNVPDTQVEHARSLARDLIKRDGQGAVMLFVVDSEFDVANNWLGIPYSKNRFRIPEGSVNVNGFGPNGSASLSLRETFGVPALRVREKHSGSYITEDGVQLVLVSI